ncbi:phage portal protein [Klenkia brasiliensis]|uniref:Phage portal protein, HK97 family n=1 Tax=Klenkia brasiliensis TaxID=333142 RepID=A0A1G7YGR1_9ACTN|nr:phage portal protein [Klenkia brasiliensis]SDG95479.1 phage portal protein, HK97 family [Klenkia brasiliensis]
MGLFSGPRLTERAVQGWGSDTAEAMYRDRFGTASSAVPVGWGGSLAIPAVWAAVRLRANLLASCPVDVYRRRPDGTTEQVATPPVLATPAAGQDVGSWLHASQVSLDLRGNAYGRIVDWDPRTFLPAQIELLHPDDVVVTDRDGETRYWVRGKRVEAREIWHERCNETPGSPVGASPIAVAAQALGIQLAAQQFGSDFFRDGAHPSALLTSEDELVGDQARVAKRRFMDVLRGREPLVLGKNWKYQPLSVAPGESQFLELMQFGVEQVARMFDLPAEMIGGSSSGSSVTYANVEQKSQDFLAYRFGTVVGRRERALSRLTVRGQFVKLNTAALLRTDLMTQYKAFELGLKNKFLGLDEVRQLMDRPPMTQAQLDLLDQLGLKPSSPTAASEPADQKEK